MSSSKLARELADLLRPKKKTSPYDTVATVKRIEETDHGTVAYVHIPGGVDETPVQMTVNAAVGDVVQIRVSGGRAHITGNATAPPTDDREARKAQKIIYNTKKEVEKEIEDVAATQTKSMEKIKEDLEEQIDKKIETWRQSSDPSAAWSTPALKAEHKGDLWMYTGTTTTTRTNNATYRWSGSAWEKCQVSEDVFDEIDGKTTIYYGAPEDHTTGINEDDYLVDPEDGCTYKWHDGAWVKQTDYATPIEEVQRTADNAVTAANGKNKVFHQNSQPSGGTYKTGDTWFDTNDGYKMYTFNGESWVAEQFGNAAIADLSITNAKIADATIKSAKIQGLDVGKLTGAYIDASHIRASDFNVGDFVNDGTYATGKMASVTTGTRSVTYATAIGYVGTANDSWTNVTAFNGVKGDMVLIPFTITDRDNASASMLCRVRSYSGTTLNADNLALMVDASANKYVSVISGYAGVCVHDAGDASNFSNMNSDGLHVYKNGVKISSFQGTYATLGGENAIVKYSEESGNTFGIGDSHRTVVAKKNDDSGVRNDATLSSREITSFEATKPMAFANTMHKVATVSGQTKKIAQVGLYAWGGEGSLIGLAPSYVVLQRGGGTGGTGEFTDPGLYIDVPKLDISYAGTAVIGGYDWDTTVGNASNAWAKAQDNETAIGTLSEDLDALEEYEPQVTTKFVRESHSITIPSMNALGSSGSTTGTKEATFSKAKHYPVAIAGFKTNDGAVLLSEVKIKSASSGSVTVEFNARNTKSSGTSALTGTVDVLWVKCAA